MDTTRFDRVTRHFGLGLTRREALRGLVAGAMGLSAGSTLLMGDEASAKRRRCKNKKGGKNQKLAPGARCERSTQCTRNHICEVPVNGSNSDTYCCGAQGAGCGAPNEDGDDTAPFCCVGHQCVFAPDSGSWTCQAVPEEL